MCVCLCVCDSVRLTLHEGLGQSSRYILNMYVSEDAAEILTDTCILLSQTKVVQLTKCSC